MSILRTLLNNTFFILLLLIAVTLYLAFSDKIKQEHGISTSVEKSHDVVSNDTNAKIIETKTVDSNNKSLEKNSNNSLNFYGDNSEQVHEANSDNKKSLTEPANDTKDSISSEDNDVNWSDAYWNKSPKQPYVKKAKPKTEMLFSIKETSDFLAKYADSSEAINAAKKAFASEDYKTTEKILFGLSLWRPSENVLGALGNVLYKNKNLKWAKKSWAAAALILIEKGEVESVTKFIKKIETIAPSLAKELKRRVDKVNNSKIKNGKE